MEFAMACNSLIEPVFGLRIQIFDGPAIAVSMYVSHEQGRIMDSWARSRLSRHPLPVLDLVQIRGADCHIS